MKFYISLLITILLTGCSNSLDEEYSKRENIQFSGYNLYYKPDGYCEQEVYERIYEDKTNIYYIYTSGCDINGEYHFIKYNGEYVTVKRAIDRRVISIEDIFGSDLKLITVEK